MGRVTLNYYDITPYRVFCLDCDWRSEGHEEYKVRRCAREHALSKGHRVRVEMKRVAEYTPLNE